MLKSDRVSDSELLSSGLLLLLLPLPFAVSFQRETRRGEEGNKEREDKVELQFLLPLL